MAIATLEKSIIYQYTKVIFLVAMVSFAKNEAAGNSKQQRVCKKQLFSVIFHQNPGVHPLTSQLLSFSTMEGKNGDTDTPIRLADTSCYQKKISSFLPDRFEFFHPFPKCFFLDFDES